jgi:GTP cyclohydrolase II
MPFENYCELPTPHGIFRMYDTGNELMRVVTFGDINKLGPQPLFRLHSSCLASEVFEAQDCDCADQLREAMKLIARDGAGVIVHMHQEGRGQGLSNKIQAVAKMQKSFVDTAEAFQAMGLEQDIRDYRMAVDMLKKLAVGHVRLISNNPRKVSALVQAGLKVDIVNTHPRVRPENAAYLKSKNIKLGHCLPLESKTINNCPIFFTIQTNHGVNYLIFRHMQSTYKTKFGELRSTIIKHKSLACLLCKMKFVQHQAR